MALSRHFLLTSFLCTLVNILAGQFYFADRHAISDELLSIQPERIHHGPGHRIYLSTKKNLYLYDGHFLHPVKFSQLPLSSASVLKDDGKYLYAGFEDGSVWKIDGIRAERIDFRNLKVTTPIQDLAFSGEKIYIATYGQGVIHMYNQQIFAFGVKEGLSSDDVYAIESISGNSILVSTDKGQEVLTVGSRKIIRKPYPLSDFPLDIITDISWDSVSRQICYATYESGIYAEWFGSHTPSQISASGQKIRPSYDGRMIFYHAAVKQLIFVDPCNHSNGIIRLNGLRKPLEIIDFTVSRDLLWVLCENNGLLSVRLNLQGYKTGLSDIQSMLRKDDVVYIGAENGLYLYHLIHNSIKKLNNQNILSLVWDDNSQELYAGTFGEGIIQLDVTGKIKRYIKEDDGIANNSILSMSMVSQTLIISSLGGVTLWDTKKQEVIDKPWTKASGLAYVYKTMQDKRGNYWIGTDRKGLYLISRDHNISHIIKEGTIFNILQDHSGRVWVHQSDGSVGFMDKNKIDAIYQPAPGEAQGVSNLNVSGVGRVIIFTNAGMYQYEPPGYMKSGVDHLTEMINFDLNINATCMDDGGRVWFGREDFIYAYDPISSDIQSPQIELFSASLGRRTFAEKDSIFKAGENDLFVNFTGLWPWDHEQLKFKYRLTGLHEQWLETKDQNIVINNLSPGSYEFELVCFRRNAPQLMTVYRKLFHIQMPFWKTWWFIIFSLAVFSGLLYTIFVVIQKRKNKINELRSLQVKSELELVKSQINPHFLFNSFNTLLSVVETKPAEAPQFISRLSDYFRKILQYRETELITIADEMKLLDNYIYLLKTRFGDQVQVKCEVHYHLDCKIIPMTLQLLIENAVKHNVISQKNHLLIEVTARDNFLEVCNPVRRKITSEPSTHYGLQSLSKRYFLMTNRKIEIMDDGTIFCVKIPLL